MYMNETASTQSILEIRFDGGLRMLAWVSALIRLIQKVFTLAIVRREFRPEWRAT